MLFLEICALLGGIYVFMQIIEKLINAIRIFNKGKAIELNPQFAEARYKQGITPKELGKYNEAISAYNEAIEINPQFAEAWNNQGIALKGIG